MSLGDLQQWVALAVAAAAALYVVRRLTGWPRKRPPLVKPGGRLGAGLDKARRRSVDPDPSVSRD